LSNSPVFAAHNTRRYGHPVGGALGQSGRGSGLYNAPGRAVFDVSSIIAFGAAFALRPLRVAQDRLWCDHDYPRWGGHNTTPRCVARLLVLGASASIMGSELSSLLGSGPSLAPALRFVPPRSLKTSVARVVSGLRPVSPLQPRLGVSRSTGMLRPVCLIPPNGRARRFLQRNAPTAVPLLQSGDRGQDTGTLRP